MTFLKRNLAAATQLSRRTRLINATRMIQRALGLVASQRDRPPQAPPGEAIGAKGAAQQNAIIEGSEDSGEVEATQAQILAPVAQPLTTAPANAAANQALLQALPAPEAHAIDVAPMAPTAPAEPAAPAAPAATAATAAPIEIRPASFTRHSFMFQGERYAYRLYMPSGPAVLTPGEAASDDTAADEAPASTPAIPATPAVEGGPRAPLLVLLHGCKQDAADFAAGTGMNALAAEQGCMVLYPEQLTSSNSMRCWNWFEAAHQARGQGEPAMIAALTLKVLKRHPVDPARVYIAGLSAGGAMATMVAALYPEMFTGVGVHSGLPRGAANDVMSAFRAMRQGARQSLAGKKDGGADGVMPTIVFHGSADKTVHPDNGDLIVKAALAAVQASGRPLRKSQRTLKGARGAEDRSATRTVYKGRDGLSYVEYWAVGAGPHAWSGGQTAGSYTDPAGPSASQAMLRFFLQHRKPAHPLPLQDETAGDAGEPEHGLPNDSGPQRMDASNASSE